VRVVFDSQGRVRQLNNYTPFGMEYGESAGNQASVGYQDYKFGGKELDRRFELNWYNFGARSYDLALGRWNSPDPLAEKYYSVSPYVYCSNNPVNKIDPNGMDDTYYDESGNELNKRIDENSHLNFVIKTSINAEDLYKNCNPDQMGSAQTISSETAFQTANEIIAGNFTGEHMNNLVQFEGTDRMKAMINSIKDDGTGGTSENNNKEYSGSFGGKDGVQNIKESNFTLPSSGKALETKGKGDYHSHASGTEKVKNGTAKWQQPPTKQDISVAGSKHEYVVGMRSQRIYIYNKNGVCATIPLPIFK